MVYYNPRYNIIATTIGLFNTLRSRITLMEYNEDGHGLYVLTSEWVVVGSL